MNTNKRRILSIILTFMFLFVINSGFTVVDMDLIENNNEVEEPELYFKMRDSDIEKQLYTMIRNPDTKAMEPLAAEGRGENAAERGGQLRGERRR